MGGGGVVFVISIFLGDFVACFLGTGGGGGGVFVISILLGDFVACFLGSGGGGGLCCFHLPGWWFCRMFLWEGGVCVCGGCFYLPG